MAYSHLETEIETQAFTAALARLYGLEKSEEAKKRCKEVINGFRETFRNDAEALFSAPGRTEIGGNHTDHQHGRILAAAINLDILAAAAPNHSGLIRIKSQGYSIIEIDVRELDPRAGEVNTSAALLRGVANRMVAMGCSLEGCGLDAYMVSSVPKGSGLSSSAAFEVLIGTMLNEFFGEGRRTPVELAKIGQYAENEFFGKPCGLMDQLASAVGGVIAVDFANISDPKVTQLEVDLHSAGYALCILNSGAGHEDLTGEYAAITDELGAVCRFFGKKTLREVDEEDFLSALPQIRAATGDRAVNRAFHVYAENRRVQAEEQALRTGDFESFLSLVRDSGCSSAMFLQNIIATGQTVSQELMVTIALCENILAGKGAVRVHGGGFGGTAQAFVPLELLERFKKQTEAVLGEGSCHVVTIRPAGGIRLG